mmetsp:Transcript_48034/g.114341  ORF Transcript_48034/g.114341 Transcript_48034/m.114341 type:complete len:217 (-) Transcript_48034:5635-6285(-)
MNLPATTDGTPSHCQGSTRRLDCDDGGAARVEGGRAAREPGGGSATSAMSKSCSSSIDIGSASIRSWCCWPWCIKRRPSSWNLQILRHASFTYNDPLAAVKHTRVSLFCQNSTCVSVLVVTIISASVDVNLAFGESRSTAISPPCTTLKLNTFADTFSSRASTYTPEMSKELGPKSIPKSGASASIGPARTVVTFCPVATIVVCGITKRSGTRISR